MLRVNSQHPWTKWLQNRFILKTTEACRLLFALRSFMSSLHCAVAGHFWASKWGDGVGLHGLVNQEQERCHNGQQQQLDPQRQAAAHWFGLTCRGHCRQESWGRGGGERRGGGRGGEGGGGGQAGDSLEFLCVGGRQAAGLSGVFWRKEAVFIIPQVAGLDRAAGSSSDRSSTGGSTTGNRHFLYSWILFDQQIKESFSYTRRLLRYLRDTQWTVDVIGKQLLQNIILIHFWGLVTCCDLLHLQTKTTLVSK